MRLAKRAQRERERVAHLVEVQLKLPKPVAEKLAVARKGKNFVAWLDAALDRAIVRVADYPQLSDLTWSRRDPLIPAQEALRLYERNWRFIDVARLTPQEQQLIERLKIEYGNGELNT
jgi:hypothetical protein